MCIRDQPDAARHAGCVLGFHPRFDLHKIYTAYRDNPAKGLSQLMTGNSRY